MSSGDWNRDHGGDRLGAQDFIVGDRQGYSQDYDAYGNYGGPGYRGRAFEGWNYGGPGWGRGWGGWGDEYGARAYGGYGGYEGTGYGAGWNAPRYGERRWGGQGYGGGYATGPGYEGQRFGGRGGWGYGGYGGRGYGGYGRGYEGTGYAGRGYGGPAVYGGQGWEQQTAGQWTNQQGMGRNVAGPYAGRGPKGYQRSDDRIEDDVNEALTQNGQLDATDIQVKVDQGVVTLTGTVDSRQDKRLAEDIADSCAGVKDVHNQIKVQQGGNGQVGQTGQSQGQTQPAKAGASHA